MDPENTSFRQSAQPQSRLPQLASSVNSGLAELTESQHNARLPPSGLQPPKVSSFKRDIPQPAHESQSKRRTLVERAEEYPTKPEGPRKRDMPRAKGHVQGQSLSQMKMPGSSYARHGSNSGSSTTSRHTSNNSFSQSMGPGRQVPSERPRTAAGNRSGFGRARTNTAASRPQTAYGKYSESEDEETGPNGTTIAQQRRPRLPRPGPVQGKKNRGLSPSLSSSAVREVSLNTRFEALSIKDAPQREDSSSSSSQVASIEERISSDSTLASIPEHVTTRCPRRPKNNTKQAPHESLFPVSHAESTGPTLFPPVTPSTDFQRARRNVEAVEESLKSIRRDTGSPSKSPSVYKGNFLTKESNTRNFIAVDVEGGVGRADDTVNEIKKFIEGQASQQKAYDEMKEIYQKRETELEQEKHRVDSRNEALQAELDAARKQLSQLTIDVEGEKRNFKYEMEDESRKHRYELDELRKEFNEETERLQRSHHEGMEALSRHYQVELEDERGSRTKEIQELRSKLGNEQQDMHFTLQKKDRELSDMRAEIESLKGDVDREQALKKGLEANISEMAASNVTLEAKINSLKSHVEFLESDSKAQSDSFASMENRLQEALQVADEARQKLIKEETERRILFNKYQELKGNIRVMCRVRPVLDETAEGESAKISFPDEDRSSAEIALQGAEETSAMGKVSRKNFNFEFDRVFAPGAMNQDVFDEISQLVQSALDGYNVCIFCYGQTGSGKTHTMSSNDGMIPRATHMIYDTMTKLEEKQWEYSMEGSFIEVYNEELHDLLASGRESSGSGSSAKKLEVRHDEVRKQTTVANCKTVALDSPAKVEAMLAEAQSNRSVAATRSNERSSRSHSVFVLKLSGHNAATGERCEGTLNLVDLAGSERLKASGAEGERMRETQNINKSLACLGDVIEALGKGNAHVPYRNSKLTHLLQYSLGGNSKTLMFVMVSPLEAHLKETLTSLRFATKVHNTHIGTAKAIKKA